MTNTFATRERVPEWDLADRLRKALRVRGVGPGEMAAWLDVSRNTVSNWINGHVEPNTRTLFMWASLCDVSFDWLREGITEIEVENAGELFDEVDSAEAEAEPSAIVSPLRSGRVRRQGLEPRTRWLRAVADLGAAA